MRDRGMSGKVVVVFIIDTLGKVDQTSVQPMSYSNSEFLGPVLEHIRSAEFRPAKLNGRISAAVIEGVFKFEVNSRSEGRGISGFGCSNSSPNCRE